MRRLEKGERWCLSAYAGPGGMLLVSVGLILAVLVYPHSHTVHQQSMTDNPGSKVVVVLEKHWFLVSGFLLEYTRRRPNWMRHQQLHCFSTAYTLNHSLSHSF